MIDPLELRRLLAVSLNGSGTLNITGTSGSDTILVFKNGSKINVTVNGAASGPFNNTAVKRISVDAGAEDDTISLIGNGAGSGVSKPSTLIGGTGNDIIIGGTGADVMDGGAGTD